MGVEITSGSSQVTLVFQCAGVLDAVITTFGIRAQPPMTAQVQAEKVAVACGSTGKWLHPSMYSSQYTFMRVDVAYNVAGDLQLATRPVGDAGTITAMQPVPINSAILVQKRTALGGRHHRGRMYVPPAFVTEGEVGANGSILGTTLAAFQTRMSQFLADLTAAEIPMALLHEDPTVSWTPVTSLIVSPTLATQRRRMR